MRPVVLILPPLILAVTLTVLPIKLLDTTLPVTDTTPSTYNPLDANTATLDVPLTLTSTLLPDDGISTRVVPLAIFETLVITPVKNAPLPSMYAPAMFDVLVMLPTELIIPSLRMLPEYMLPAMLATLASIVLAE